MKTKTYCDVKYDVRYHKTAQKSIQMMLECQPMIGLSCKFVSLHIFTRGSQWSYQWSSQNMIFWLLEGLNHHCALKYDVKYHKMAHSFTRRSCSPSCYRVKICYQVFKSIRLFVYFSASFISIDYDDISWSIRSEPIESHMIRISTPP